MTIRGAREAAVTISGIDAFYAGASADIGIRDVEIMPSAFFSQAKSESGDIYFFYGKPRVPALLRLGLSAKHKTTHRVGLAYYGMDFEIVNDNGVTLFSSGNNYGAGIDYGYSFPFLPPSFGLDVTAGFNYARIEIDGSLTAANQQYFLFPYEFYDVTILADATFGWLSGAFEYRRKNLTHRLTCMAVNFLSGELRADARFKHRPRFWNSSNDSEGEESLVDIDMSITRGGLAMYSLIGRIPVKAGGGKFDLGFELRKAVAYSWRMDDDAKTVVSKEPTTTSRKSASTVKTILLSGLSLDLRAGF